MNIKYAILALSVALVGCGAGAPSAQPQQSKPISNVVAFMGDSITQYWNIATNDPGPTLNFGVVGETTTQMLARFQSEVIANAPGVVVILGGINDIEEYEDGFSTAVPDIKSIEAMAAMARSAGIRVILCSVMPTNFSSVTAPALGPLPAAIEDFNPKIIALAQANGYLYADYYDAMLTPAGTQNTALFMDAAHPNVAGYAVMWSVLAPLIKEDQT